MHRGFQALKIWQVKILTQGKRREQSRNRFSPKRNLKIDKKYLLYFFLVGWLRRHRLKRLLRYYHRDIGSEDGHGAEGPCGCPSERQQLLRREANSLAGRGGSGKKFTIKNRKACDSVLKQFPPQSNTANVEYCLAVKRKIHIKRA